MCFPRPLTVLAAVLSVVGWSPASAQFGGTGKVAVSLVSEATIIEAGKPFTVALRMEHPAGFHTYWINPGVGTPTTMTWKLPDGWTVGEMVWPIPKLYGAEPPFSHTYEGTVYHLAEVTPPPGFAAGAKATLKAGVRWLECDVNGCRPAATDVELTVTAGAATTYDPTVKAAFDKVRAQQARPTEAWTITAAESPTDLVITLTPKAGANPDPGEIYFFERNKVTVLGPPEVERMADRSLVVTVLKEEDNTDKPEGFLSASKGWLADGSLPALDYAAEGPVAVRSTPPVPDTEATTGDPFDSPAKSTQPADPAGANGKLSEATLRALDAIIPTQGPKYVGEAEPLTFWWALLLAFVGGIILNAMPCVFPVLGIKVLGFVQQSGEEPRKVRMHGLVFTLGLLIAMWILAGLLIALNFGGARLGWGFQQQSPGFTAFITILLFAMGLNLIGVFEMGTSLTTVGGGLMDKGGYAGSFFTGALTTLIATPCSGPFLGAAMGYALQQPALLALLLFTSFGFGIALPSLILSLNPALLKWLPRPGAWMETFKVVMAFPILATVIYFLNVLAAQTGASGLVDMLIALLLLGLALWIYGHWSTPSRKLRTRWIGRVVALGFAGLGIWAAAAATGEIRETKPLEEQIASLENQVTELQRRSGKSAGSVSGSENAAGAPFKWEKWSPERVRDLREQGRAIFVDFTAEWCWTCITNKKVVFGSPGSDAVKARFLGLNVVALKADWTNYDPVISEFLFRNGLPNIPANFVYPADASKPPILLPQGLLVQGQVLEAIEKAAGGS